MNHTTKEHFTAALKDLLGAEGDFSNNADDPGGRTRFGITEAVAREHGYEGPMRELPVEIAKEIYWWRYWVEAGCDHLPELDPALAKGVFEAAVNLGVRRVVKFLQRTLNASNLRGRYWSDILVDGDFGPKTLAAVHSMHSERGQTGMDVLRKHS